MSIVPQRGRAVFQKLERDVAKLSSKLPAESVHRFRTGTRRLQILLGELSPKLDRNEKKLLKRLGRIRKRAGRVRDLDVQLTALRSFKFPRQPRRKTELINSLIELRSRQEKKLRKEVDAAAIREIRKRLKRAAAHFNPKTSRDPLAVAKAMLAKLDASDAPLTEAVLHQYRILSKRARYAAEFATPSPDATSFIAAIKSLQDALGDWHDWLTLTQTATAHLGGVRDSPLVAELHNVTGAKFRNAVTVLRRARGKQEVNPDQTTKRPLASPPAATRDTASAA